MGSSKNPLANNRLNYACYLINLNSRPDRLADSQSMFNLLGAEFQRINAVEAKNLKEVNPFLSQPAEACFYSHMKAIRKIANGKQRFGVVVEDDFEIINIIELKKQLSAIEELKFDIVQIGWLNNMLMDKILIKFQDWEADLFHVLYLMSQRSQYLKNRIGGRLRVLRNGPEYRRGFVADNFKSGCHFYIITKEFAQIISNYEITPTMPIDNLFATLSTSRKFRILRTRKSYVTQNNSVSSIKI
jgi:glycosyl transferase family 25